MKLSMLDAVLSFMWIDAAGNEVLPDGDGSQPGKLRGRPRPFRFLDGWGAATPHGGRHLLGCARSR